MLFGTYALTLYVTFSFLELIHLSEAAPEPLGMVFTETEPQVQVPSDLCKARLSDTSPGLRTPVCFPICPILLTSGVSLRISRATEKTPALVPTVWPFVVTCLAEGKLLLFLGDQLTSNVEGLG